jgi:hypothetical protein
LNAAVRDQRALTIIPRRRRPRDGRCRHCVDAKATAGERAGEPPRGQLHRSDDMREGITNCRCGRQRLASPQRIGTLARSACGASPSEDQSARWLRSDSSIGRADPGAMGLGGRYRQQPPPRSTLASCQPPSRIIQWWR